jgi:hypothetical protein
MAKEVCLVNYPIYFSNRGVGVEDLTPTIVVYKKVEDGTDVSGIPVVVELGEGFYKFAASPSVDIVVKVDGGDTLQNSDRYKVVLITADDNNLDVPVSSRAVGSGYGTVTWEYTLTEVGTTNPIPYARLWITTDDDGNNVIATGFTNEYGKALFYLDPGTVYVWRQKAGIMFDNPDIEVVSNE